MAAPEPDEAPGRLDLLRLFVNTLDLPSGPDALATPAQAAAWCQIHGLPSVANQAECDRLRAFREALRDALFANNGEGNTEAALAELSAYADAARFSMTFDPSKGPVLKPRSDNGDLAIAALLTIVFEAMAEGTWPRLRACRKETCRFAYYDRSKNASRAWCSMAVCGNREKAQRRRLRDRAL